MYDLKMVCESYPHIKPLKDGRVKSDTVRLHFTEFEFSYHAFDDQVENRTYDVCELAIGTFFQALDFNKRLRLLPVVCLASFHHGNLLYDPTMGVVRPHDLKGARVAVRAYTQTTGLWCRGALQEHYGISPDEVTWVTTEGPHVSEYACPPNVVQASGKVKLIDLLASGDCKAAIMLPRYTKGTNLQPVIPNVLELVDEWNKKHNAIPINHMICVTDDLLENNPDAVQEVYNMLKRGYQIAKAAGELSPAIRIGQDVVWNTMDLCMDYCVAQKLISRKFTKEEIFAPVF